MFSQLTSASFKGSLAGPNANSNKWCGWCLKRTEQKLVELRTLRSTLYECSGCHCSNVPCATSDCDGMSRRWVFGVAGEDGIDYHENTCLLCQGIIDKWDNPERQSAIGWCSWCLRKEVQLLFQKNTFTRDVYSCATCSKRTLPCRRCSGAAFSKGHPEWDDELCVVCDGSQESWSSFLSSDMIVRKYCSFCNLFCIHKLEDKCVVRASSYRCCGCKKVTIACTSCSIGSVIKEAGGSILLELSRDRAQCRSCKSGVKWEDIAQESKRRIQIESDSSIRARTSKECDFLLDHIHRCCSKLYPKDKMLIEQGKPSSQVVIVEDGCCRAEVELPNGKILMVADDLKAGEVLGELGFLTKGISKASIYTHDTATKCSVVSNTMIMESLQPGKKSKNTLRADMFFRFLAIKLVQRFQDLIAGKVQPRKVVPYQDQISAVQFVPDITADRNQFVRTVFHLPSNESCISIAEGCCKIPDSRPVFGTMYLMDSYFGFHGNVFGFETTYIWTLSSISDVRDITGSSDIGFSLLLTHSISSGLEEEDDSPLIIAGITVSVPEPAFRFDFFGSDVRDDFLGNFRALLANAKFKNFSIKGQSHIINDISTIRLRKQKELEDFLRRRDTMSRFTNSHKQQSKGSATGLLSIFKTKQDLKPAAAESTIQAEEDEDVTTDDNDEMDIDAIVDGVEMSIYNRSETILVQGSCEHNLYQVARGSAEVQLNGKTVAVIGVGAIFGEISFVLQCAANATVCAAIDGTLVYSIDGKFIQTKMQRSRRVSASIYRFLADVVATKIKLKKAAETSAAASRGGATKAK